MIYTPIMFYDFVFSQYVFSIYKPICNFNTNDKYLFWKKAVNFMKYGFSIKIRLHFKHIPNPVIINYFLNTF